MSRKVLGLGIIATLVLGILHLEGTIDCSWVWVLAPIWVPLVVVLLPDFPEATPLERKVPLYREPTVWSSIQRVTGPKCANEDCTNIRKGKSSYCSSKCQKHDLMHHQGF